MLSPMWPSDYALKTQKLNQNKTDFLYVVFSDIMVMAIKTNIKVEDLEIIKSYNHLCVCVTNTKFE